MVENPRESGGHGGGINLARMENPDDFFKIPSLEKGRIPNDSF